MQFCSCPPKSGIYMKKILVCRQIYRLSSWGALAWCQILRACLRACAKYLKEGAFNWFKYLELLTKLSMHTEQYQDASEVIVFIHVHPHYEFSPENVKEIWLINDARMYLLIVRRRCCAVSI